MVLQNGETKSQITFSRNPFKTPPIPWLIRLDICFVAPLGGRQSNSLSLSLFLTVEKEVGKWRMVQFRVVQALDSVNSKVHKSSLRIPFLGLLEAKISHTIGMMALIVVS